MKEIKRHNVSNNIIRTKILTNGEKKPTVEREKMLSEILTLIVGNNQPNKENKKYQVKGQYRVYQKLPFLLRYHKFVLNTEHHTILFYAVIVYYFLLQYKELLTDQSTKYQYYNITYNSKFKKTKKLENSI